MIFNEIYSAYYNTVAQIITHILQEDAKEKDLQKIVSQYAFGESILTILPALKSGKWQLINEDLSTSLEHVPTMPLTILEKRWLKAISLDHRIKLYETLLEFINDAKPYCYEFAKALINQALFKEKTGYKVLEDAAVTQFWNDFYHYLVENTADITMPKPEGAKGANSTWIPFYHNLRHTSLQYKTNFGCVDLEFTGTAHCSIELKSRLKPYLSENMIWAETGKSMSLRICVPKTDVHRPFATYIADMPQITLAIRELMNTATSINNDGIIDDLLK